MRAARRETTVPAADTRPRTFDMPTLLGVVVTRSGAMVDVATARWLIPRPERNALSLPVGRLDHPPVRGRENPGPSPIVPVERRASMVAPDLAHAMKLYLVQQLPRYAERSVRATLTHFLHFERWAHDTLRFERRGKPLAAADVTGDNVVSYRDYIEATAATKGQSAWAVTRFYRWALRHGYPGFTRAVAAELRGIAFEAGLRGHIANMACPYRGAFEFEERLQIDQRLREGAGPLEGRAAVMLFWYTGIRTEAAVLLRRRHVVRPRDVGGHWWLLVPAVKQRGGTSNKVADTSDEVVHRKRTPEHLGETWLSLPILSGDDPPLLPLTTKDRHSELRRVITRWADDPSVDLVTARIEPGSRREGWRANRIGSTENALARLPLTPYRFRRTIAMMLANQGADEQTIAAALLDKTLAMAVVYAQNSSSMVEILEKTLDRHPAWLRVIGVYRGELLDEPSKDRDDVFGGAFQLANYEEYKKIGKIGECSNPNCTLFPPVSCYRCPFFKAVPNAQVHRAQMGQLKEEIYSRVGIESDRMASVFDRDLVV
jgi:integrase